MSAATAAAATAAVNGHHDAVAIAQVPVPVLEPNAGVIDPNASVNAGADTTANPIAPPTGNRNNGNKCNNSRGWVVQKFGGTSVGKFAVNIAEDIVR